MKIAEDFRRIARNALTNKCCLFETGKVKVKFPSCPYMFLKNLITPKIEVKIIDAPIVNITNEYNKNTKI